jgi:flagellar basal body-associated protein FliL
MKDRINIIMNIVIIVTICLVIMTMVVLFISSWRNGELWYISSVTNDVDEDVDNNNIFTEKS